jgi:hypothetical protein
MGTQCKAISIAILLGAIVVMIPTETASGYDGKVHRTMTSYAVDKFNEYYPGSEVFLAKDSIACGGEREDDVDVVFDYSDSYKTIPHFWDADRGPWDPVTCYLCGTVWDEWPNAWQKISYQDVGDYHSVPPYMGLWDQVLSYYRSGQKEYAYMYLGHIAHLIQDMSVPAHAHEDFHSSDYYEDMLNDTWSWAWQVLSPTELAKGLIDYSKIETPEKWTPSLSAIYYLLYTTNQRADFFGSEGEPGNTGYARGDEVDPMGWADFSDFSIYPLMLYYQIPGNMKYHLWACEDCDVPVCIVDVTCPGSCPKCHGSNLFEADAAIFIATRYTLVYAIRATETLFEVFLKEITPTTSIEIGLNKYATADGPVYISPDTEFTLTATYEVNVEKTMYRIVGNDIGYDSGWLTYSVPFSFNDVQTGLADGEYTIHYQSTNTLKDDEDEKTKVVYLTTKPVDYRVSVSTGGSYLGIQAAIDAAPNGNTIEVKPGTFRECVDFKGKTIYLWGIGGAEVTTIDADGGLHVVTFNNGEGKDTALDGFTITGGKANGVGFPNDCGAGILCDHAEPVIRNCIIRNNYAATDGGGIHLVSWYPLIQNCLIYNNSAINGGGLLSYFSQPTLVNCTFSANEATGNMGGAIASYASVVGNTPILYNCILSGDKPWEIIYSTVSPFVWNSDVQQDHPWSGGYYFNKDPKFVDAINLNFHLTADSPCIGVGDNIVMYPGQTDLDGYPRILDGLCDGTAVVDMGAYEFSYAYQGDLDGNCAVDLADLAMMAAAWMADPADRTIDIAPGPAGDGVINILDFAILAEHWMEEKP